MEAIAHNRVVAIIQTRHIISIIVLSQIGRHMTPIEELVSIVAAITHDLDHPGVNQNFLIATNNHLAQLYEVNMHTDLSSVPSHHLHKVRTSAGQSRKANKSMSQIFNSSIWPLAEQSRTREPSLESGTWSSSSIRSLRSSSKSCHKEDRTRDALPNPRHWYDETAGIFHHVEEQSTEQWPQHESIRRSPLHSSGDYSGLIQREI